MTAEQVIGFVLMYLVGVANGFVIGLVVMWIKLADIRKKG